MMNFNNQGHSFSLFFVPEYPGFGVLWRVRVFRGLVADHPGVVDSVWRILILAHVRPEQSVSEKNPK